MVTHREALHQSFTICRDVIENRIGRNRYRSSSVTLRDTSLSIPLDFAGQGRYSVGVGSHQPGIVAKVDCFSHTL